MPPAHILACQLNSIHSLYRLVFTCRCCHRDESQLAFLLLCSTFACQLTALPSASWPSDAYAVQTGLSPVPDEQILNKKSCYQLQRSTSRPPSMTAHSEGHQAGQKQPSFRLNIIKSRAQKQAGNLLHIQTNNINEPVI